MKKILIVEDVEWNRDLLMQLLEEEYAICQAGDGLQGLEVAEAECPDLILMDLQLPRMDGWELASRIRKHERIGNTPIIAVTAHAMTGDEEKALQAGCNDYISKPIDEDLLLDKVRSLIGK